MSSMLIVRIILCEHTWWTEARAAWTEAVALILIFALDFVLAYFALQERKEARRDRRLAEIARQRSEVTCQGVTSILRSMTEAELCTTLWAGHYRHAGFAFESGLYAQLPEYLRRKCDPFAEQIGEIHAPEQHKIARFLLVFTFPYPNFDAILVDVNHLHFGTTHVVWDENGKPIPVDRT